MEEDIWDQHRDAVQRLRASYAAIPAGSPVRLAKRTSNLFRPRAATSAPGLDVSGLDGVLEVDPVDPDRAGAGHVHLRAASSTPRWPTG